MEVQRKLAILADAAKYDASCASSGTAKRNSRASKGIGSATGTGICHSYTPDGRCVSLLKILLTNYCIYDCLYCINRISSDVPRAHFTIEEAGRWADRISINIELPTVASLLELAPEKNLGRTRAPCRSSNNESTISKSTRRESRNAPVLRPRVKAPR